MVSCFHVMSNKGPRDYFYQFLLSASMLRPQVGSRAAIHWLRDAAKARIMALQCLSGWTALPAALHSKALVQLQLYPAASGKAFSCCQHLQKLCKSWC